MSINSRNPAEAQFGLFKALVNALTKVLEARRESKRKRRSLTHLSELPPHLLRDIGFLDEARDQGSLQSRWQQEMEIQSK